MINLRSDTTTRPTPEMREAMAHAQVGDVRDDRDDPTVQYLEEMAADRLGKEAALYLVSGCMCDTIALKVHTRPLDEVVCPDEVAVYVAGMLAFAGLTPRLLPHDKGHITPEQVADNLTMFSDEGYRTGLVVLENTFNIAGGVPITAQETDAIAQVAHANSVPVHLDGARVFNSAVAQSVDVKELVRPVDSLMFCVSKGLGAPIGSILLGSKEFIREATRYRNMMGGGWRQAGIVAAAGIVSLEKMVDRLAEDHANARILAEGIANIPGLEVDVENVRTNIVFFDVAGTGISAEEFCERLTPEGVKAGAFGARRIRMVTHKDISTDDVKTALAAMAKVASAAQASPAFQEAEASAR